MISHASIKTSTLNLAIFTVVHDVLKLCHIPPLPQCLTSNNTIRHLDRCRDSTHAAIRNASGGKKQIRRTLSNLFLNQCKDCKPNKRKNISQNGKHESYNINSADPDVMSEWATST
jgi:hypothetical protein